MIFQLLFVAIQVEEEFILLISNYFANVKINKRKLF